MGKADLLADVIGTFMGRDALSLAVSLLRLGREDTVLLPAYLCREVLKPFLGKSHVVFYDLGPNLAANPEEIQAKVIEHRPKAVLIINYFGFLQPCRKEIRKICSDEGSMLLEDCAHSLLTDGSGETGDISIYSFRKLLPVPDGGGLKMNMEGKPPPVRFYPQIYSNFLSLLIALKLCLKIRSEIVSRAWITSRTKRPMADSPATKAAEMRSDKRILPLSSFARRGIGSANCSKIIEMRRADYRFWQERSAGSSLCTPLFNELPEGVCPLGFPVKIKNRDSIKARLQGRGFFLKTHWNLSNTMGVECVNSHALARDTLTFPIYPELGPTDREAIVELLDALR